MQNNPFNNLSPGNVGLAGGLIIAGGLLNFMDESLKFPKGFLSGLNSALTLGGDSRPFQKDVGKTLILVGLGVAAAQANLMSA